MHREVSFESSRERAGPGAVATARAPHRQAQWQGKPPRGLATMRWSQQDGWTGVAGERVTGDSVLQRDAARVQRRLPDRLGEVHRQHPGRQRERRPEWESPSCASFVRFSLVPTDFEHAR